MSQERIEDLRLKILEGVPTVGELREYCYAVFQPRPGMDLVPANEFITDDAVKAFEWLSNWWRLPEYPQHLQKPNLLQFLWAIYIPKGAPKAKLTDKFLEFWRKGREYCIENGLNPDEPFEDPEEKRKRRNRERMAKVRAARKVPIRELANNDTLRAKVREIEALIEERKAAAKAADEEHRQEVLLHQQRMIEASQARRATAQSYKDEIEKLRLDIKALTAKQ